MVAILIVLALSANTSFADFPRLCRALAENGFLPWAFAIRGRRLVFSYGINVLAILSGILLIVFQGVTDKLIPLFAVGAFLAFTLSQAGMVMHWKKSSQSGARFSMFINGLGATATGLTLCVVIIAKFTEGAWITVIAIPVLIMLMMKVHRHYQTVQSEIACPQPANLKNIEQPIVVLPLQGWNRIAEKALRFAYTLSTEVHVIHIAPEDDPDKPNTKELLGVWKEYVEKPARQAGYPPPELVVVRSPYRLVLAPIYRHVLEIQRKAPDRLVTVLVPELVERHWIYYFLHNQRATALKLILYVKGSGRIVVVNIPWYVSA